MCRLDRSQLLARLKIARKRRVSLRGLGLRNQTGRKPRPSPRACSGFAIAPDGVDVMIDAGKAALPWVLVSDDIAFRVA